MAAEQGIVVRMDARTRKAMTQAMCFVVGVAVAATALSRAGVIHNPNPPQELLMIAAIFVVGGGLVVLTLFRNRVALYPDRVEVSNGLSPMLSVALSDVIRRRIIPARWRRSPRHVLILEDGREVWLPPYLERNTEFQAWLAGIPLQKKRNRKNN